MQTPATGNSPPLDSYKQGLPGQLAPHAPFHQHFKKGIDMNLVAFRQPTHVYWLDSCPFGLGGYLVEGFAWHFEIPEDLHFGASNNLLKCIMSIVLPWVDMLAGRLKQGDCALLMMDSSMSVRWLRKINFREIIGEDADPAQAKARIKTVRHHATPFPQSGHKGILPVVPRTGEQHCRCSLV
jgi:hypothetical protein